MAKQAIVPLWAWVAVVGGMVLVLVMLPKSVRTVDPVERAFWSWAEENANDPDAIELVSIEGPRRTEEGPLYRIRTRTPIFGTKLMHVDYFIIDEEGARKPPRITQSNIQYHGFEVYPEM